MSHRLFNPGVLASIAVVAPGLALLSAQTPVSAPAATPAAGTKQNWTLRHTPDGYPDLQGVWTNNTLTPLERPKNLGAKEFYTDGELTDLMKKEQARVALNEEEGRPKEPGS